MKPWTDTAAVGKPAPRVDAFERVTGTAVYSLDLQLPGMLHAAIVRCPHAHARVKRVDMEKARKMPGVRAVLTADSPGAKVPWYAGEKGPVSVLFDPHCRYEGEEVAAIAADTATQARDAAAAVVVEYEELPFVIDPVEAVKPGAPEVLGPGNRAGAPEVYNRGDVKTGFADADTVIEQEFATSCQLHVPMEVHGSVAQWEGSRLTVWDTTQGVFDIQHSLAQSLNLPQSSVRVISHYMGGGFGSKLELGKYTVIAALLARRTGTPVKLFLSREETFLCVGNRPANRIRVKAGVKKDGTLTALDATLTGVSGAYPDGATSGYLLMDLYRCANVHVEESSIYIHAGRSRAFRAPGFPQCAWALEQTMDMLAEKIGLDPVELRLKNLSPVSQLRGNIPYTSNGLDRCLTEGASKFGWAEARRRPRAEGAIVRGVGMAAGMWGYEGEPQSTVILKLFSDGSVNLNMGASDLGTGMKTVAALIVSEELGVPTDRIQIENADTGTTQYTPGSGGSQTTLVNSPAIRAAAEDVRRLLIELAAVEMKCPADDLSMGGGRVFRTSKPDDGKAIAELKSLEQRQVLVGIGRRAPHPVGKIPLPFCTNFAEVEVNLRTGEIRVLRLLGGHDSGRVMSLLTYENQVFGGMLMGLGLSLTEQRVLDRQKGRMVNANWHDYKIPTALDVPLESTCVPIDPHDTECNTTGTKGLGEPATITTAAAIANAIYHATGIRVTEAPVTPARMLRLIAANRQKGQTS
jgi:CO/xanthine dehydrogenase Mo-binding subunit